MNHQFSKSYTRKRAAGLMPVAALILSTAIAQPVSAQVQDTQDGWQWRGSIYGYLPSISATTQFPVSEDGPILEIDAGDILGSLDFTFMGALKARKGSWGFFTDILYLDVGGKKSTSQDLIIGPGELPASVNVDANLDLKSTVWTVSGTYNLSANPRHESDLYLGARMVDISQNLKWDFTGDISDQPLPGRSGNSKVSVTNWDAVIGVSGYVFIGDDSHWMVPYLLDVGTGDSDLTWQAMAGLGYQFGWGSVVLTYRYLDYDLGSDSPVSDLTLNGPQLGVSFHW